jgi:hypothetical protein
MATRKVIPMLLVCFVFVLLACSGGGAAQPAATQAPPTVEPTQADTATPTVDLAATQAARQTAEALSAVQTQTAEALALSQTADANSTATALAIARKTQTPAARATMQAGTKLTATAAVQATAAALEEQFQKDTIAKLYSEGVIGTDQGEYIALDDYEDSQAQINYYFPKFLDITADNFVLSTDMKWSSASNNANWPLSGCGFIYGDTGDGRYLVSWLGLDGYVYNFRVKDKINTAFAFQKWGTPERPNGEAHVDLVVNDKRVNIYVNDRLANTFYDSVYKPGELAWIIMSGTNKGYGTRCNFSHNQAFLLQK